MDLPSSTVITPSLPTISIAFAIKEPTSGSPAEIAATCSMALWLSTDFEMPFRCVTVASTAFLMPSFKMMGFAPAARFFKPSLTIACAKTTAVVVPSPATSFVFVDTSFTSCAPIFSKGSLSSISFAMVTPSLVIRGAPNFLSSTTFLPLGPRVILTVSAKTFTPASNAFLASSPYLICFAIFQVLLIFSLPRSRECRFV